MKFALTISTLGALSTSVRAAPAGPPILDERAAEVSVSLESGSVVGTSLLGVERFNGIPYAEPPTGPLRLKPPKRFSGSLDSFDATGLAPACPQMFISSDALGIIGDVITDFSSIPFLQVVTGQEDCLTMNVHRPAGTKEGDDLPVLFWIFGGGFELGATNEYDAGSLLSAAVDQDQPFIFVAVNYRVAGFGFMPGKEILEDGSANLGLLDQRMGLEWTADNIRAFGGDPDKVTIWGESAGAISVLDQMALYDGNATYKDKPLFRGAIMDSGSVVPAAPVDCPKGQAVYDSVVEAGGCSGADDTLECLRGLDYDTFLDAANSVPGILSYNSVALSYLPRPDGKVLTQSPDTLIQSGKYHAVPMIIGDQEDEGTLFSLFQFTVNTSEDLVEYFHSLFFPDATKEQLAELVDTYAFLAPSGSPFRTGFLNELYIGFKRLAAMLGDLTFTLSRRLFLHIATSGRPDVPAWSYLASYNHGTPFLGTFHASDLLQTFYGILPNYAAASSRTYYFNFLYHLDPNKGVQGYDEWPEWTGEGSELMWFETSDSTSTLKDDFRNDSYEWIKDHLSVLYI